MGDFAESKNKQDMSREDVGSVATTSDSSDSDYVPDNLPYLSEGDTVQVRKSERVPKPETFDDYATFFLSLDVQTNPLSVYEVLPGPEKEQWRQAMQEECNWFIANEAWEITDVPEKVNLVGV